MDKVAFHHSFFIRFTPSTQAEHALRFLPRNPVPSQSMHIRGTIPIPQFRHAQILLDVTVYTSA